MPASIHFVVIITNITMDYTILHDEKTKRERKMAIGKIDCTVEKELCKAHGVRGYPTLKYYRDGEYHDYPSGRDADSIM